MQALDLVGCTADMTHLVLVDPSTGERFRARLTTQLITTLVEMLESSDDDRLSMLRGVTSAATHDVSVAPVDADAPSPAAALVSLGTLTVGQAPRAKLDGSASRLSPSEIQRLLRAGKAPESVAEQAGVSLDWVLRWFQPIAAEQGKVITSVLGGRQEREGFGLSDDLIGDSVRTNLLARDVEPDEEDVQWSASRRIRARPQAGQSDRARPPDRRGNQCDPAPRVDAAARRAAPAGGADPGTRSSSDWGRRFTPAKRRPRLPRRD